MRELYEIDETLSKLDRTTQEFFGSKEVVVKFVETMCYTGSVALTGRKMHFLPLLLHSVVKKDKALSHIINMAKNYALEIAEGMLYERAVYGYEEETYDDEGKTKKRKYSDRALIDYLKANNPKYTTKSNDKVAGNSHQTDPMQIELMTFSNET